MITPSTFIVGAGPVATALAGGMRLGGVPVLGLWARKPDRARAAGSIAGVAAFSAAPPDLLLESDVVVLAVRDEAIAEVARTIVATGLITPKHVLVHCSGALAAEDVFADVRGQVGGVAAMHPLRAIADPRTAMRDLRGTVFGIEGDDAGVDMARALVAAVGGRALELSGAQMAAYHSAAAIASNFLVALVDAAAAVLTSAGVNRDEALAALLPLVRGTVANLESEGLPAALTGPIRRGDSVTVARHLKVMASMTPELAALYRVLGRRTLEIARQLGDAPEPSLDEIERLLDETSDSGAARAVRR